MLVPLLLSLGCLGLVRGGKVFSSHLRTAFPVMRVNGLGKGAEVREGVGFANAGDLILDLGQKSMVQLLVEGDICCDNC